MLPGCVALRKESVDRNCPAWQGIRCLRVALRKESVDRNYNGPYSGARALRSLSARRAWIEIGNVVVTAIPHVVALRKESVDRNLSLVLILSMSTSSLSARRAWIEMLVVWNHMLTVSESLSARRAWIEIILPRF